MPELVAKIDMRNSRERSRELASAMGWRWRLPTPWERAQALSYGSLATCRRFLSLEARTEPCDACCHTGMGKTVAM
jgi:hypothetical protein